MRYIHYTYLVVYFLLFLIFFFYHASAFYMNILNKLPNRICNGNLLTASRYYSVGIPKNVFKVKLYFINLKIFISSSISGFDISIVHIISTYYILGHYKHEKFGYFRWRFIFFSSSAGFTYE